MSQSGVEGLFRSLHADARWSPPVLTFDRPQPQPCPPGCGHPPAEAVADRTSGLDFRVSERGLTIVPSVFSTTCVPWIVIDPSRGPVATVLTVPIPASWELFADRQIDHRTDPLARLLGATRSWVLKACAAEELTTSKLARAVGISVSSASEHTSALRAAGLITSHRERNLVLHRPTPIGRALLRSTSRPVHSGAARTHASRPSEPSKPTGRTESRNQTN
jgi:DNA-binding transcriptional ArsR family regulator